MLELKQVAKHYRSRAEDVHALDGVSMLLDEGEMLALQGPSGSGKTTLLLLAAGALRADAGAILYGGRDLAAMSERQTAQHRLAEVGLIAQDPHLMANVSAVDNAATKLLVGGVPLREARERASHWLERLGLGARMASTPEQLSRGERQRVALARALAGEPHLVLADEPTANLDSRRSTEIIAVLRELSREQGRAVLLVTHDDDAAAQADRVLRLRDGRLVGQAAAAAGT